MANKLNQQLKTRLARRDAMLLAALMRDLPHRGRPRLRGGYVTDLVAARMFLDLRVMNLNHADTISRPSQRARSSACPRNRRRRHGVGNAVGGNTVVLERVAPAAFRSRTSSPTLRISTTKWWNGGLSARSGGAGRVTTRIPNYGGRMRSPAPAMRRLRQDQSSPRGGADCCSSSAAHIPEDQAPTPDRGCAFPINSCMGKRYKPEALAGWGTQWFSRRAPCVGDPGHAAGARHILRTGSIEGSGPRRY
jgi:hypothetical protein